MSNERTLYVCDWVVERGGLDAYEFEGSIQVRAESDDEARQIAIGKVATIWSVDSDRIYIPQIRHYPED